MIDPDAEGIIEELVDLGRQAAQIIIEEGLPNDTHVRKSCVYRAILRSCNAIPPHIMAELDRQVLRALTEHGI